MMPSNKKIINKKGIIASEGKANCFNQVNRTLL